MAGPSTRHWSRLSGFPLWLHPGSAPARALFDHGPHGGLVRRSQQALDERRLVTAAAKGSANRVGQVEFAEQFADFLALAGGRSSS